VAFFAYPTAALETVSVDISRLSDTYQGTWPERPERPGILSSLVSQLLSVPQKLLGIQKDKECHWSMAQRRFNVLLTVVLRDRESGQEFCVGNYHMPCAYYAPFVMTMHGDLCLAHVQRMAAASNSGSTSTNTKDDKDDENSSPHAEQPPRPYILAGDFNFKPVDPVYRLLTTGTLGDNDLPTPPSHRPDHAPWKPTLREPVQSAYAVLNNGHEPDFTNYARVGEAPPFIDTLDYIFVAPRGVDVESVLELPHRDQADGPFPNADEPSDHVLLAANVRVTSGGGDGGVGSR